MEQVLLFVRHGSIPVRELGGAGPVEPLAPLRRRGLSPRGREEARAAQAYVRRWLEEHGRVVERVYVARSRRAEETCEQVFASAVPRERARLRPGHLRPQLDAWFTGGGPSAVIALVGHGPSLQELLADAAPDAPDVARVFGVVAVFARERGGPWRLRALGPLGAGAGQVGSSGEADDEARDDKTPDARER
ncbi:MAG: histidine phosphatase family protein [Myxococcales bacterium]|nr:histidine phosphatase family protein [Myxococcales bacterium]MCB9751164.1 histidine phosphatase family protein [Myxococcales bacterium]